MQVEMFATFDSVAERELRGAVVVVVDVLRATSVIATALFHGCREVIPVAEVDEAMEVYHRIGSGALLGGERRAVRIEGFHLSNSPLEYASDRVSGRTLILTTTNGTRAIRRAKEAKSVMTGCLLNASAVAKAVAKEERVVILCAGTLGRYSIDDCIGGGAIIRALSDLYPGQLEMDDLSLTSLEQYDQYKRDPFLIVRKCRHFEALRQAGYEQDVHFCMQQNVMNIIPTLTEGVIRAPE